MSELAPCSLVEAQCRVPAVVEGTVYVRCLPRSHVMMLIGPSTIFRSATEVHGPVWGVKEEEMRKCSNSSPNPTLTVQGKARRSTS